MPNQEKNELLQHLVEEIGEDDAQQVYNQLPDEVETPEEFEQFVKEQRAGAMGGQETAVTPAEQESQPAQSEGEAVVRTDEQVSLDTLLKAAKPAIAEYMSSQEEQKRIEKEEREEELKYEERSERRWQIFLGVILTAVMGLTVYFGEKSASLGLQIFTHITTAAIGGFGGYGIGRSWSKEE